MVRTRGFLLTLLIAVSSPIWGAKAPDFKPIYAMEYEVATVEGKAFLHSIDGKGADEVISAI